MKEAPVNILYVEDDPIDQMAFKQYLKANPLPFAYSCASSVADAKNRLSNEQFDIVICDYSLGDGNAFDIFSSVTNKAPIIFVTSVNDLNLAVRAMREGAYDYLVKDLDRNYLGFIPLIVKKALAHRKADEDLEKAQQQVAESLKVKEQFLTNISHEIRTPMNAIVGFAGLLERTSLSPEQKQYIHAIRNSGENLLVIINDILDFSRTRAGMITFENIPFNLEEVVSLVHELLASKALEKKIAFTWSIEENVPPVISGDPTRLNQVLINLAGNAIKFTETGEVKIIVKLAGQSDKRVRLEFRVMDTGIGIPREKLNTIFREFVQGSNDTARKYGGSGLGLAIVKQLVEMQGGTVGVTSEPDKGSTFSFQLEFEKSSHEHIALNNSENKSRVDSLDGLRVLVVEDNALNRILVEKHLLSWNCKVDHAGLGRTALEKIRSNDYDLVLMDLQLPEMDGYETTSRIRKDLGGARATIPIIALTAHALEGEEEKCLASGMNGYLTKPFDPVKMNALITRLVRKKGNIDLTTIRKYLGDDKNFIAKMLQKFMADFEQESVKLDAGVVTLNWDLVRMQAHKMLGSSRIFQFNALNELLEKLETYAANRQEPEQLPQLVMQLKKNYLEIADEIRAFLPLVKA